MNLAKLAYSFYHVSGNSIERIARYGDWEQIIESHFRKDGLTETFIFRGICEGGYNLLIDYCVKIRFTHFNFGLQGAVQGRHHDIVQQMIQLGAHPEVGLMRAGTNNDVEMIAFLLPLCEQSWITKLMRRHYGLLI
jgi:hypothetical protein